MWVEAILVRADIEKILREAMPMRLVLGADGWMVLTDPRDVELVSDVGLRMSATVHVHWPVLGVPVPVAIRCATLELRPSIEQRPRGDALVFTLALDDLDVSLVPPWIARGVVRAINDELAAKHVELAWNLVAGLSRMFELPESLASARAAELKATWATLRITTEALVLAVSFNVEIGARTSASPLLGPRPSAARVGPKGAPIARRWLHRPRAGSATGRIVALGAAALVLAAAWLAVFALSRPPAGTARLLRRT